MEGNTVNDIIMPPDEEEKEETIKEINGMKETFNEIGESLFKRYIRKTSCITQENRIGITQAMVLNEYMDKNYGYRFTPIDELIESTLIDSVSVNSFGIAAYIEGIKSIQATYEQHQVPEGLKSLIPKIR